MEVGIVILHRMVRKGLTENLTLEQKFEEREREERELDK